MPPTAAAFPDAARLRVPGRFLPVVFAACAAAAVLASARTIAQGFIEGGAVRWTQVLFEGTEWLFLGALTPITLVLGRRFPLRGPRLRRALAVHLGGAALLCLAWAALGTGLRQLLGHGWDVPLHQELAVWSLISLPWAFLLYFFVLGTVHAFAYREESRQRELQAAQLAGQLSDARLRALRAQLQPHFLFNTLNAITVLVRDREDTAAVGMLDRLSVLLRHVLRADQPHEIPLRDELALTREYLAIEQVRFSDRLRADFDIEEAPLDALVPTLLLQPLVENAIRHGLAERLDGATIVIGARRTGGMLEVWVRDNGRGPGPVNGAGVGLENTRERLSTLYGERASLALIDDPTGGAVARVVLPWRTQAAA